MRTLHGSTSKKRFVLTVETLRKSERGENLHQAKDADDMFKQLGI